MGFPDFCPELKIRSIYAADPNAEAWGDCGRRRMRKTSWLGFVIFVPHANFERAFPSLCVPCGSSPALRDGREILFVFPKFRQPRGIHEVAAERIPLGCFRDGSFVFQFPIFPLFQSSNIPHTRQRTRVEYVIFFHT